jgi:leader peptidase (prepilin peptidase)/N-methyltransferase
MTLLAFYIGIIAGGGGIAYLMLRGKIKWGRGDSIPLVPFLAVGGVVTFLCGPQALNVIGLRLQYFIQAGWPW